MSDQVELIRYNIVIEPNSEVRKAAITLSKELSKKDDVLFTLDGEHFYPHITIYSPAFPSLKKEDVFYAVEEISKDFKQFVCGFTGVQLDEKYLGINIMPTDAVTQLHETIVKKLNPVREGVIRKKYLPGSEEFLKLSQNRQNNVLEYGAPDVLELYHPHLTITRFKEDSVAEKVSKENHWEIQSFVASEIGIYEMGENGTCINPVQKFLLTK